jgi:hypothetical protein
MIYAISTAAHMPNNQPLHSSPKYGVKSYELTVFSPAVQAEYYGMP